MSKKKLCKTCVHLLNIDEQPEAETGSIVGTKGVNCKLLNWWFESEDHMAIKCKFHAIPEATISISGLSDHASNMEKRLREVETSVVRLKESEKIPSKIDEIKVSNIVGDLLYIRSEDHTS